MKYLFTFEQIETRKQETIKKYKDAMKPLSFEEVVVYIENHCTEWLNEYTEIIRGINSLFDKLPKYFLSDPVKRYSRDNKNFYTLIMDNSIKWKGFPKRSNSFCCGTKGNNFSYFHYLVIPEDGSKWGVAPENDLWNSFNDKIINYIGHRLTTNSFFKILDAIAYRLKIELIDDDYKQFRNSIIKLEKKVKKLSDKQLKEIGGGIYVSKILKLMRDQKSFWRILLDIISPENFKLMNWSDLVKHLNSDFKQKEVWTDSTCIFVERTQKNINKLNKALGINIKLYY